MPLPIKLELGAPSALEHSCRPSARSSKHAGRPRTISSQSSTYSCMQG
uniref:Uncharacterized protein n=1 Tax=Triticum urartu TaxID=4572 RepID=A0A8R7Q6V7_TRIUA